MVYILVALSAAGIFLVDIPGIILARLIHRPRRKWGWYLLLAVLAPVIRGLAMWLNNNVIPRGLIQSEHAGYLLFNCLSVLVLALVVHFILRLKLRETILTALIILITALILFYVIGYATTGVIPEGGIQVGEPRVEYS